ncbi:TetR/AcrR family transcriptional regulator [Symbioplanes lichenis]|uniref:TetR/AcrR family transcriptional regulator n=1 Tax=Symbioplanes lichenis TaxID=1629072 RepID=UPI0027392827|nr:TetR family transcriptional regulator [Actinoplanes lichenis]
MPQQTAPPGRRDRKKQQTRQALIAAALRLVDERGLDHVTVEDIAEAADVSPRTFFNYFATKDEAITGDQFVDDHETRERFLRVPREVPTVRALLLALEPLLTVMEADHELWLLRFRVMDANPALIAGLIGRSAAVERELVTAIALRLGVSPEDTYPQLTAAVAGAALRTAVMRWAAAGGTPSLVELAREAFDLLAHGLTDPTPTIKDNR